jgi:cyclopropane-fatty-acyl-phospholipid synthase
MGASLVWTTKIDRGMGMSKILQGYLSTLLKCGSVEVETATGAHFTVGDGTGEKVGVRFADKEAQVAFMLNPIMKFGELFMEHRLEITRGTLYDVIATVSVNVPRIRRFFWVQVLERLHTIAHHIGRHNNKLMARRNVHYHYDLDRRLYEMFLDGDMQYSCAYFERDDDTLDTAQLAKKRHIAAKLLIDQRHRVLDIGCGWGGMALYLASVCGAKVTGVTLSEEQLTVARQRAETLSINGTDFRLQDYRDINERFDRIVSVGMFEHVGVEYYNAFFQKMAALLTDDGVALLHTIGHSGTPGPTNPWITKYIFPGGYIPSLSEISKAIEKAGLVISDIEVLRLHYAKTLHHWHERFMARRDDARKLYDERFCRMWEFYLQAAESAFVYEDALVYQIQLSKKNNVAPLTRAYIAARETELRRHDSAASALKIAAG